MSSVIDGLFLIHKGANMMVNFNEIQFSIDIPIQDLDAICINSFSTMQISTFYSFDRKKIGDKIIVYKFRTNLHYMPELGEIRLISIGDATLISIQAPRWPTRVEEFLLDQHFKTTNAESTPKAHTSLTLVKSDSKETTEITSQARTKQMAAWNDFRSRFISSLQITDQIENGPTPLNKKRFDLYERIKKENPELTQAEVATQAGFVDGEKHSVHSVRNTYRMHRVNWDRGARTM